MLHNTHIMSAPLTLTVIRVYSSIDIQETTTVVHYDSTYTLHDDDDDGDYRYYLYYY